MLKYDPVGMLDMIATVWRVFADLLQTVKKKVLFLEQKRGR